MLLQLLHYYVIFFKFISPNINHRIVEMYFFILEAVLQLKLLYVKCMPY